MCDDPRRFLLIRSESVTNWIFNNSRNVDKNECCKFQYYFYKWNNLSNQKNPEYNLSNWINPENHFLNRKRGACTWLLKRNQSHEAEKYESLKQLSLKSIDAQSLLKTYGLRRSSERVNNRLNHRTYDRLMLVSVVSVVQKGRISRGIRGRWMSKKIKDSY